MRMVLSESKKTAGPINQIGEVRSATIRTSPTTIQHPVLFITAGYVAPQMSAMGSFADSQVLAPI